jgi:hypothetical protein
MKRSGVFVVPALIAVIGVSFPAIQPPTARADEGSVPYPESYRSWTFLHSSLVPAGFNGFGKTPCVKPCTNGIFHFYANELAMKGLRTGVYEDGAMIAEEMLEFLVGEKGNGGEGKRVLTAVMVKDSRRYAATGGWGFGHFEEGSKVNGLDTKAQETCYQCHVSRKDAGYVFTRYVER